MSSSTAFAGSWESLQVPLTPWVLDVIRSMGHTQMTPVQASTIPLFMKHKDVVVEAVTGSGKTLAFVIPVIERLVRRETKLRKHEIAALVISPTRELATQIHSIFSLFLSSQPDESTETDESESLHLKYPPPLLLISSNESSPAQDIKRFKNLGADIVIGTPGRVEEFLLGKGKGTVDVRELDVLVLDEADRLLDLGFQQTLTRILTHLPKQRRTGLFSATMTDADDISELVRAGLRNPARITVKVQSKRFTQGDINAGERSVRGTVEERRIPANLENYYLSCRASEKIVQLSRIVLLEISKNQSSQFIVYFATCACVDYFYKVLPSVLPLATFHSLHGNLPPSSRTRTLSAFSSALSSPSSPSILLATDVAARGLDLPHVDVVVQFDPPSDTKTFSHRCGRTARAGRSGRAWVLLVGRETDYVDLMHIRKIPIKYHDYLKESTTTMEDGDRPEDPQVSSYLTTMRKTALMDRTLHDQAIKAFVSFVRAYSKHEASYIFRTKDLDLIGIAKSFGLLRLPKMPELKTINRDGWEDAQVDWDTFAYADKAQETKRLATKAAASTAQERDVKYKALHTERKMTNTAWSNKAKKKEDKELRRGKKDRRKKWLETQTTNEPAPSDVALKRAREDGERDKAMSDGSDWEDLAREERMAKKVKKGTMDKIAFDAEFGVDLS